MKEKLYRAFNGKNYTWIAIILSTIVLFDCKSDPKDDKSELSKLFIRDEVILNYIINPLLDSNRYFFTNSFDFPPTNAKPTIDLGLIILDTLDSVANCEPMLTISTSNFNIDTTKYFSMNKKGYEESLNCVIVRFTRICFINDVTAFFYVKFYRDADFSKEDKVIIIRKDDKWVIDNIENKLIS